MKKYQNQHDFCLGHGGISVILTLCGRWKSIFCHHCIKKLAKSSAIQNISITLFSVIIAIIVCIHLYFNTIKIQQFSLITNFLDCYNSSNSR